MSTELAPIATKIIYEDDHVRVWNQVLPAGATIEKHAHEHDYVLLNVAGEGPIDVQFHAGSGGELGDQLTFSPQPRTADFVAKGHIETARNDGEEYRAILVEFKRDGVR
ncbi:MAG: hypothetical protein ACU85U_05820 [Gammaproteobacteria bacterium]